ncbi:MAG: carboxypeptidase-like regulatory domain-containing protein [Sediminibacterium sp.]
MKHLIFVALLMIIGSYDAGAQTKIKLLVQNSKSKVPLQAATVNIIQLKKAAIADSLGMVVFENVPNGTHALSISYVGCIDQTINITTPLATDSIVTILMDEGDEEEEEEVIVTATRISRTIANTPIRTEVISGEELTEKGNMKPGDIRMLLNESTGIQTQQTSATSFNAGIRIQGLDGRYTQLLRDGYH